MLVQCVSQEVLPIQCDVGPVFPIELLSILCEVDPLHPAIVNLLQPASDADPVYMFPLSYCQQPAQHFVMLVQCVRQ